MLSCVKSQNRLTGMQTVWRTNIYHFNRWHGLQHFFNGFEKRHIKTLNIQAFRRCDIHKSNQFCLIIPLYHLGMSLSDMATTDDCEFHFGIAHNFVTFSFFNSYQSPLSGHLAFWFSLKSSLCPYSLIHPVCLAGFPNTRAYGATDLLTTEPSPIKAY